MDRQPETSKPAGPAGPFALPAKPAPALYALMVLAFSLRAVVGVARAPHWVPTGDEDCYRILGRNVLAGQGIRGLEGQWLGPIARPGEPTSVWNCGQALYIAAIIRVFGDHPLAVFLVNAALGALTVGLAGILGRRACGAAAGLVAALLVLADPHAIHFSASYYTEPPYMFLLTAGLVLVLLLGEQGKDRLAIPAGLVFGLAALFRATAFYFLPLVALALWLRRGRNAIRPVVLVMTASLAVVLPWIIRNLEVHRSFVLLDTKAGWNLYTYYHPQAESVAYLPLPPELRNLREARRDALLVRLALGYIRRDPATFLRRGLSHLAALWSPLPSGKTQGIGRIARPVFMIPFEAFAVAGLVLLWRTRRELAVLYFLIGFYSLMHFVMLGGPRFRLPTDPVLAVFAGCAAVGLMAALSRAMGRHGAAKPAMAGGEGA